MKVNDAMLIAIWCAASAAGGRRPASAVAAANTPTSRVTWLAAGNPSATSRRMRVNSIRSGVSKSPGRRPCSRCRMTTSRKAHITTRAETVAHAEPRTPIAGAPR